MTKKNILDWIDITAKIGFHDPTRKWPRDFYARYKAAVDVCTRVFGKSIK